MPIELGLVLLVFITFMYVQHVFSLMPTYLSGAITSRPDAEEGGPGQFGHLAAVHIPVLGLWLLLLLWHRSYS